MSQSAITIAFEDYLTQQVASGGTVTLDQFIFANVPDLDPNTPIDRSEQIPVDYIVYQQAVTLPGVINNNEVVYSVTMGTEVGDFDFNWIGLVNSSTSLLGMVTHAPVQQKFKNADGQQGNTLTRSFLMEYDGAATATAITTPAETWQIDFTARLAGMDERQRLENMDIYGYGAFFGDGYLVWGNPTDGYTIDAGVGYVDGLRVQLDADQSLNVAAKPINVYVDACWKGTLTSVWNVHQQITLASDLSNYTDADGTAHYVFAVASIDANGTVSDLRPSGSKDNQALSGYLQTKNNLAEIAAAGAEAQSEARDNLGLGSIATHDEDDFLPIAGGTLTGDLNGTNAKFTGVVTAPDIVTNRINSATSGTPIEFGNSGATGNVDLYLDFHTTFPEVDYDYRIKFSKDSGLIALLSTKNTNGLSSLKVSILAAELLELHDVDRTTGNALISHYDPAGKLFANYGIYNGGFSVNFYDENGAWVCNPFFVGANGNATVTGNLSGGAVYDAGQRVYSPWNLPPATDLSGYVTSAAAYSTFVQGVRLGSPMQHDFNAGGGAVDSGGTCVVSFSLHGGSDNGGTSMTRYVQVNINGVWANVGVAS